MVIAGVSSWWYIRGGSSLVGPPSGVNGAWFAFQSTSERDRVNQCHPAAHSEAAVANDVFGRLRCDWVIDAVSAILPPRVPTPDPRRPSASRTVGTCSIASSMECAAAAHDSAGFSSLAADSSEANRARTLDADVGVARATIGAGAGPPGARERSRARGPGRRSAPRRGKLWRGQRGWRVRRFKKTLV